MDMQISLKRLLLTVLLSTLVITAPGISMASERGQYGDRNDHHYNRDHGQHNKNYSNHGRSYKYDKHRKSNHYRGHKYDKHHDYGHKRRYSSNRHYLPGHAISSRRNGVFLYWLD